MRTRTFFDLLASAYVLMVRRWFLTWGTTAQERTCILPGDELILNPTDSTTHAVTIAAPPRLVWPWLVQMGQDRAGFYTHNWVERLLRSGIPDVNKIHPEWQHLAVDDLMRTNRERRPGEPIGWPVALVEPEHALVLRSNKLPVGTYGYVILPIEEAKTRVLVRDRVIWSWWQRPFQYLIFEPLHAYMETGVLKGIKVRAELASRRMNTFAERA
jgi:hypothetical protein